MKKGTGINPRTGIVENCYILEGFHGWQDGVCFESDPPAHDRSGIYGANEIAELSVQDSGNTS